jgi:hypothetical protein
MRRQIGNYTNRSELISLSVDLHKVAFSVSQSRNEIYLEINMDGSRQTIQSADTRREPDHDGWVFFSIGRLSRSPGGQDMSDWKKEADHEMIELRFVI